MEIKPLLALMAMCRTPYPYIATLLDIESKFYIRKMDTAIREYLEPAEGSKGKGRMSMEAFVERSRR